MVADSPVRGPSVRANCRTYVLSDAPATTDDFGSHSALATAVASIIKQESTGRSIGLAGPWGVGKSTVVNFLEREIAELDGNVFLWKFDAWAHEGDPLRRTFLESLINALSTNTDWLTGFHCEEELKKLRGVHRSEETHTTHRISGNARAVGLGILLVPLGTVLFQDALAQGLTLAWTGAISGRALLGLVLAGAPVILPVLYWTLRRLLALARGPLVRHQHDSHAGLAWLAGYLLRHWIPESKPKLKELFQTFERDKDIDTYTDSFIEGEPTSLEFSKTFGRILRSALGNSGDRKLVMVVDNIDRLPRTQAKEIWATLQPFMQPDPEWNNANDRLFTIVTYDPEAIRRLGVEREETQSEDEAESHDVPIASRGTRSSEDRASFIEKTVRVEYLVPRPLLSDWRRNLYSLLRKALPDHDAAQLRAAIDICSIHFDGWGIGPTPRQLKAIVNGIGSYHRMWCGEISVADICYHVLRQRQRLGPEHPVEDTVAPTVGADTRDNLYALAYSVPVSKARQLRMGGELRNYLVNGDAARFEKAIQETHGYWEVIAHLIATEGSTWLRREPATILRMVPLLVDLKEPDATSAAQRLANDLRKVTKLDKLDRKSDQGAAAFQQLVSAATFQAFCDFYLGERVAGLATDEGYDQLKATVPDLMMLAESAVGTNAKMNIAEPAWFAAFATAAAGAGAFRSHPVWRMFPFTGDVEELWAAAGADDADALKGIARALSSEPDSKSLGVIAQRIEQEWTASSAGVDSNTLRAWVHVLAEAMATHPTTIAGPVERLLDRGLPQDAVGTEATNAPDVAAALVAVQLLMPGSSDLSWLEQHKAGVLTLIGREFAKLCAALEAERVLITKLIEEPTVPPQLVASAIASKDLRIPAIPLAAIGSQCLRLNNANALQPLIAKMPEDWVAAGLVTLMESQFAPDYLPLYLRLLNKTENRGFAAWLAESLIGADEASWSRILGGFSQTLPKLRGALAKFGHGIDGMVSSGLKAVLADQVRSSIASRTQPKDTERFSTFVSLLEPTVRRELAEEVYQGAIDNPNVLLAAWFFDDYGELLAESRSIEKRAKTVDDIFVPIAKRKGSPTAGVKWMEDLFARRPEVVTGKGKRRQRVLLRALEAGESKLDETSHQRKSLTRIIKMVKEDTNL